MIVIYILIGSAFVIPTVGLLITAFQIAGDSVRGVSGKKGDEK